MNPNTQTQVTPVQDDRGPLAKMVMQLFEHWKLTTEDQLSLLGLSATNRSALTRYRKGEPLANTRDLLERAGHLLAIHKNLRLLLEFRKTWAANNVAALVIYATAPIQKIVGIAHVKKVHQGSPTALWKLAQEIGGGVSRRVLYEYFQGRLEGVAIEIETNHQNQDTLLASC